MRRLARPGLSLVVLAVMSTGCGARMAHSAAAPMMPMEPSAAAPGRALVAGDDDGGGGQAVARIPEALVVEGALRLEVDDVASTALALRAEVERGGGRVVGEQEGGAARSWEANLRLRVPPAMVDPLVVWLTGHGDVTAKRITATDVSRTLFEQQIALDNKRATLDRLRKLYDQGGLAMADILAIEKEMSRLRGEIEQLEGEQRFLEDRVALATLEVTLHRKEGVILGPESKLYPGPRLAALTLLTADGRQRTRWGGGVAIHMPIPRVSWELDIFEAAADKDGAMHQAALATFGGAVYSDFLGRGRRRFLNPYLGLRLGYGYLDGHAFVAQGEAGVELFKHQNVLVDVSLRGTGFLSSGRADAALVSGASVIFAF